MSHPCPLLTKPRKKPKGQNAVVQSPEVHVCPQTMVSGSWGRSWRPKEAAARASQESNTSLVSSSPVCFAPGKLTAASRVSRADSCLSPVPSKQQQSLKQKQVQHLSRPMDVIQGSHPQQVRPAREQCPRC